MSETWRLALLRHNRVIMHFLSPELEEQIFELEMAYATTHGIEEVRSIRKTIFRVAGSPGAYRFEVVTQIRRDLPK